MCFPFFGQGRYIRRTIDCPSHGIQLHTGYSVPHTHQAHSSSDQNASRKGMVRFLSLRHFENMSLLFATALTFWSLSTTIAYLIETYTALPFWDQWLYALPEDAGTNLFQHHSEHLIILGRLGFLIDLIFFRVLLTKMLVAKEWYDFSRFDILKTCHCYLLPHSHSGACPQR